MKEKASLELDFGGFSTAGIKSENQDAFAAVQAKGNDAYYKGHIAVVADGVSVCERGAEASQVATNNFVNDYYCTPESWSVKESAARVINSLNSWLYQQGTANTRHDSQLITTFTATIFKSITAHIFHVGDTSVWRYSQGTLERLTRPHVLIQKTGNAALSRALGMDIHLEADYLQCELTQDDLFLLLSDSVEGFLNTTQLKELLSYQYLSLDQCAQRIINQALSNGSDDNLSCVLCKVKHLPSKELDEIALKSAQQVIPPVMSVGNKMDGYI